MCRTKIFALLFATGLCLSLVVSACTTGDAPVVFAQATGAPLVYVANTPPSPS